MLTEAKTGTFKDMMATQPTKIRIDCSNMTQNIGIWSCKQIISILKGDFRIKNCVRKVGSEVDSNDRSPWFDTVNGLLITLVVYNVF